MFLLLTHYLSNAQFLSWGWRVPFLASAALVGVGLYIRLRLVETPEFRRALESGERVRVPMYAVVAKHARALVIGTIATVATFEVFYLMTVFLLSWATGPQHFPRQEFLVLQMICVLFFGLTIPLSAVLADRIGSRAMMIWASLALIALGFAFEPLFGAGSRTAVFCFMAVGFAATGLTYGPLGNALAMLFPTAVRYTGTSLAFNLAGILGASIAPYVATRLATEYGLAAVGYYLSAAAAASLIAWIAL